MNYLADMFERQKTYDELVYKEHRKPELWEIREALRDELGELHHELKTYFCWWKHTQKPLNSNKVLEELVDVLHFALMYCIEDDEVNDICDDVNYTNDHEYLMNVKHFENSKEEILEALEEYRKYISPTAYIQFGIIFLGFSYEQIYYAYCKKNDENLNRLKRGY